MCESAPAVQKDTAGWFKAPKLLRLRFSQSQEVTQTYCAELLSPTSWLKTNPNLHLVTFFQFRVSFLAWTSNNLLSISGVGEVRCLHRAQRILKDKTQPSRSLFTPLLSDKRYRSTSCCATRLQSSLTPQTVGLLNFSSTLHSIK